MENLVRPLAHFLPLLLLRLSVGAHENRWLGSLVQTPVHFKAFLSDLCTSYRIECRREKEEAPPPVLHAPIADAGHSRQGLKCISISFGISTEREGSAEI